LAGPYNPLDRVELGKSVERALLARPLSPLPPHGRFVGAGLYAIYYVGGLPLYQAIAPPTRREGHVPMYVGRAQPKGARRGIIESLVATTTGTVLFDRLRQHANSIERVEAYVASQHVEGLRLSDFRCRYLVADDIWVPLGEALLIAHYRPVWNVVVDGFGDHALERACARHPCGRAPPR
jgi:Eco29kI restriction endonuclease